MLGLLGVLFNEFHPVCLAVNYLFEIFVIYFPVYYSVQVYLHVLQTFGGLGLVGRQLLGKVLLTLVESVLDLLDINLGVQREQQRLFDIEHLLHRASIHYVIARFVEVSSDALQVPAEFLFVGLHDLLDEIGCLLNVSLALLLQLAELLLIGEDFVERSVPIQFALLDTF